MRKRLAYVLWSVPRHNPVSRHLHGFASICANISSIDIEGLRANFGIAAKSVSVVVRNSDDRVIRPIGIWYSGTVSINFGYAKQWISADRRQEFYNRFAAAGGPFSTKNYDGYPSFPIERLSDDQRAAAFEAVAADWINAHRNS